MKAIDPVCGMSVEPEKAGAKLEHEGKVYYFCAASCAKAFAEHPEKYLSESAAASHRHGGCCGGHGRHHAGNASRGHAGGCHH